MAAITITANFSEVAKIISDQINKLKDKEYLLRPVAQEQIKLMHTRIHEDGKASDGNQIGIYSTGYMAVRTGKFKNTKTTKSGKQKGSGVFTDQTIRLNKKAGVFTGEDKVGTNRPNYNRNSDTKVIISLTRQLENDYAVVATEKGYGIGFNNSHNADKAKWVQETYKKKIFNMTSEELQAAIDFINELTADALD